VERKSKNIVVLLTDFGASHYTGIMHGVILRYNPYTVVIDLTHNITAFSVLEASFILHTSYKYFPEGSIFIAVVDPGVGTERSVLITLYNNYTFVAPDNGLLSPFFKEGETFRFTKFELLGQISSTFHGRDVFAPIGGLLSRGESPHNLGVREKNPTIIEWWKPQKIDDYTYQGIIIHIDRFGNAITSIPCDHINSISELRIKNLIIKDKFPSFGYAPFETPFIYCGSSGFLEIALRENNFAKKYNISPLTPLLCTIPQQ